MINFCSKKNLVGLNISDYSIKVVDAQCVNGKFEVVSSGMLTIDQGVLVDGRIKNVEILKGYIEKVFADANPKQITSKDIAFAIPEKQVYSHIFEIKASQEKDLNKIAYDEALSSIPLDRGDLIFSYKILERFKVLDDSSREDDFEEEDLKNKKEIKDKHGDKNEDESDSQEEIKTIDKIRILVVGVSNEVVEEWKNFFDTLNIKVEYFYLETFSTFQGLFEKILDHPVCLVDIGANITNVSIISEYGLMYSSSINAAGNYFSEKLREGFGKKESSVNKEYDQNDVDRLKREVGVLPSDKFIDVPIILKSAVLPIVEEIKIAIKYYNLKTDKTINEVILVGGSSQLKGIAEYIESNLSGLKHEISVRDISGVEDAVANKDIKVIIGNLLHNDLSVEYAGALGLSLKKYNKDLDKFAPVIPVHFNMNEYSLISSNEEIDEMSDDKQGELEYAGKFAWVKNNKRMVKLIVLLIIGALSIGWAFWYRDMSAKRIQLATEQQKTYDKAIDVRALVAVEKAEYSIDTVKGRIYKDIQEENLAIDKLVSKSKESAMKQVKTGEKLWEHNLNILDEKRIVYPVNMAWLVYNEKDVAEKFINEARKQHNDDADFGFKNIEVLGLENTDGKYYLTGVVNISTKIKPIAIASTANDNLVAKQTVDQTVKEKSEVDNKNVSNAVGATSSSVVLPIKNNEANEVGADIVQASSTVSVENKQKFVSIDDSGLIRLNVRTAPSKSSDILTMIYSKKTYELLEEQTGWLKIKIDDKQQGWVTTEYAKILK